MKISRPLLRLLVVGALAAAATPTLAQSNLCRDICGPDVDCDTPCLVDGAQTFWTTCASSSCRHCDWYDVDQHQIGANDGGLPPIYCTWWVTFEVRQRNSCDGSERYVCRHWQDGFGVGGDCCMFWGCWGASDCP
jgi:hypothetical protein